MSSLERRELELLRAKVARYEAPMGWQLLQHRDIDRSCGQGEFSPKGRRCASISTGDGEWRQL